MNIHAANSDIRQAAFSSGVYLWEIAEAMGVTDGTFSCKLRRELDEKEKKEILKIIKTISKRKEC